MINLEGTYNNAIKIISNMLEDIRFCRKIKVDEIRKCAEELCQYLHENNNILSILNNVEIKYPYNLSHPVNVAIVSCAIGKWMNIGYSELVQLVCSGLLHDIGKAKIKDRILNKPGKLSEQEMEIMKSHPSIGYAILEDMNVFEDEVLLGVLSHHERQDGTGYPNHLKGEQISLFGRIISVADIYDAMTSTKVYNTKSSPFKVVEEIESNSFGSLDPNICQVFLKNIINFYPRTIVRLSNELIGEIIYINPEERARPTILCGEEYINMTKERDLEIVEMLRNSHIILS